MVFLHGFVHADLHPGNVRFLAPGRVVLLDLGLVGQIEDDDRLRFAEMLFALSTGDGRTVARSFYDNAPHTAVTDYTAYEREIVDFVDGVRARGLANLQVTLEIGRIFDILRRHRVQARSHMTMVNLALMSNENGTSVARVQLARRWMLSGAHAGRRIISTGTLGTPNQGN